MSGITDHGIRYPDGATPAKQLGSELKQMADDLDEYVVAHAVRGPRGTVITGASAVSVPASQPATATLVGTEASKSLLIEIPRGLPGTNAIENDAAVAAYVAADDSETAQAIDVRSEIVARSVTEQFMRTMRPNGSHLGIIGDSLQSYGTEATSSSVVPSNGPYIWKQIEALSRQRVQVTHPVQDPGDTIDDALTVQLPALLAQTPHPDACVFAIARNNAGPSLNLNTFMEKAATICDTLAGAGIVPLIGLPMPTDAAGDADTVESANLARIRVALQRFGAGRGYPTFDQYDALADITGGLRAGFDNGDHTHLTRSGYEAVADSIMRQGILDLFPPAPHVTLRDTADQFDILEGSGLFTEISPTGWGSAGGGLTVTHDAPATSDDIVGRLCHLTKLSGEAADVARRWTSGQVIEEGHTYLFTGKLKSTLAGSGATLQIAAEWRTATAALQAGLVLNQWARDEWITFSAEITAPPGATVLRFPFYIKGTPSRDAAIWFGEVGCRDLTAMGITE